MIIDGSEEPVTEQPKEKKVEYLELIYDLIFVFIIGRNNLLLHHVDNGYVTGEMFLAYVFCTLAVIQIWSFTTFYINIYGRNGVRDYVFMFINMYLLYHMADGISSDFNSASLYRFNIAWALILVNIAAQHLIELRNQKDAPWLSVQLKRRAAIIFAEAALVGVNILVFSLTGTAIAYVPIVFGIVATILSGALSSMVPVDFPHLSERVMLYVVFTFGEMIISLSSYFSDELTPSSIYFSTMAFLIVVGLFLCYGTLYNRIIDRETVTNGTGYMMIHVFMLFALNNLSVALEFMRDDGIDLLQKTVLLVGSFVLFFTFMFLTGRYAKHKCAFRGSFVVMLCAIAASFVALMFIFREMMYVNIAVSAVYVFAIFLLMLKQSSGGRKTLTGR